MSKKFKMSEKQLGHRSDMPPKYRTIYDRAIATTSRKAAIRSFCLECCGWNENEVRECTSSACPLFKYRRTG